MSEKCRDIAQHCREVREEVFRHLTAFTAIEISLVQTFLPNAIAIAGGWAAVVATVLITSEVSFDGWVPLLSVRGCFALVTAALVFAIPILYAKHLYQKERGKALRVAGEARAAHLEDLTHYIGTLEDCCRELQRSGCASEEPLYCRDLNRLQNVKRRAVELLEEREGWP